MKNPAVLIIPFDLPPPDRMVKLPRDLETRLSDDVTVLKLVRVLAYSHAPDTLMLKVETDRGEIVLSFKLEVEVPNAS